MSGISARIQKVNQGENHEVAVVEASSSSEVEKNRSLIEDVRIWDSNPTGPAKRQRIRE